MKKRMVLLGGGRTRETRSGCFQAFRDLHGVLIKEFDIFKVWVDEHGFFWLKGEDGDCLCSLQANRLIKINPSELLIGAKADFVSVDLLWPLFHGENYSSMGLVSNIEFGGFDLIGSSGMMSYITHNSDLARGIFKNYQFEKNPDVINRGDWYKNYLEIEQRFIDAGEFPLMISFDEQKQIVSVPDNFSNVIFAIFEDENVDNISIDSCFDEGIQIYVGFLGGINFLPSKVCQLVKGNNLEIFDGEQILIREIQNMVIDFVKNYQVSDYGVFAVNVYGNKWKIAKIDLHPDVTQSGLMARMWRLSGLDYSSMINKIVN